MHAPPTMHVMIGLPAAGKTTEARRIASERQALRLTPDEWMIPLFGAPDPDGRRDVLEGRLLSIAVRALGLGVDVVLDFGAWTRSDRTALRALAADAGARCRLVYLDVSAEEQRRRIAERASTEPATSFSPGPDELARYAAQFEPPHDDELAGATLDGPPTGEDSWRAWAVRRWPSLEL